MSAAYPNASATLHYQYAFNHPDLRTELRWLPLLARSAQPQFTSQPCQSPAHTHHQPSQTRGKHDVANCKLEACFRVNMDAKTTRCRLTNRREHTHVRP
ncbi:hypothetical protein TGCOUG_274280 [Toxoplasma gondii COUG]|uniref:Uncharacterized protein n=1 Tax=Toxoplasma gondii COUG TaxID=1074873 RepID=A0A2G8XMK7_TOXGO|nr:hypothetical protein TGCOUG_274280 [Toxoplasma gondii COUG]